MLRVRNDKSAGSQSGCQVEEASDDGMERKGMYLEHGKQKGGGTEEVRTITTEQRVRAWLLQEAFFCGSRTGGGRSVYDRRTGRGREHGHRTLIPRQWK